MVMGAPNLVQMSGAGAARGEGSVAGAARGEGKPEGNATKVIPIACSYILFIGIRTLCGSIM